MSKDITVLTPNGRRQNIHCTPNTTILQILEDVCHKHGLQPNEYDLKHHKNILDLTTTVRYTNLPNKAFLEMVESERKREESNVTIGLTLEDGERRTAAFLPNVSLYEIAILLAPRELESFQNPTIYYMRQEVSGLFAMKEKTLRHLGLLSGRAILRLLNKAEEQKQANVSSVYRAKVSQIESCDVKMNKNIKETKKSIDATSDIPTTSQQQERKDYTDEKKEKNLHSHVLNPIDLIRKEKLNATIESTMSVFNMQDHDNPTHPTSIGNKDTFVYMEVDQGTSKSNKNSNSQESYERRLKIEEEVTFVGTHKAIAFKQPEGEEEEVEDLPDDFYDLTIDEVRKLYRDLQNQRVQMENTPLLFSSKREELQNEVSLQKSKYYKHAVVRIQFPDQIILQGVFLPTDTIDDINKFIKEHLQHPERQFQIYTTPLKEALNPDTTLLKAKFVPCVHMHFQFVTRNTSEPYLKEEIYAKLTTSDAAKILASKYRSPSAQKLEEWATTSSNAQSTSKAKNTKVPKWFK